MSIDTRSEVASEKIDIAILRPKLEAIYKNPQDRSLRVALKDWLADRNPTWSEYLALTLEIEMEDIDGIDRKPSPLLKRRLMEHGHDGTPADTLQKAWLPVVTPKETSLAHGHSPYTWENGIPMMDIWINDKKHVKSMEKERTDLLPIGRVSWFTDYRPSAAEMQTILTSPQTEYIQDIDLRWSTNDEILIAVAGSKRAENLRSLHIGGNVTDAGIQAIANSPYLKNVEDIFISNGIDDPISDGKIEALMNATFLPNLKRLRIFCKDITPASIDIMAKAVREERLTFWPDIETLEEDKPDFTPMRKEFETISQRKAVEKKRVENLRLDTTGKLEDVIKELQLKYIPKRLSQIISKSRLRLSQIRDVLNGFEGAYEGLRPPIHGMYANPWRADTALEQVREILADTEATNTRLPKTIKKKLDELTARILPLRIKSNITRLRADVIQNREKIRSLDFSSLYRTKAYVERVRAKRDTWWEEDIHDASLGWPGINENPGRLMKDIEELLERCDAADIDTTEWRKEVDALRPEIAEQEVIAKRLNTQIAEIYEETFRPWKKKEREKAEKKKS